MSFRMRRMIVSNKRLLLLAVPMLVTIAFLFKTNLINTWGQWYSLDISYRLQTNAFLNGTLKIQDSPAAHGHDWAWHKGWHQIWGLGVPLIRLLPDAISSLFDFPFPDRLTFLFFYFLTASVIFYTSTFEKGIPYRPAFRLGLLALLIFNPAFQRLVGTTFSVYEEAIAYNCLWAILTYVLTVTAFTRSNLSLYFAICVMAGFSMFIRPTGFIYGFSSFLVLSIWHPKIAWKARAYGAGILTLAFVCLGITNLLRFDNPFELGHAASIISIPSETLISRIGAPFADQPFAAAARELLGGLFFESTFDQWKAPIYRQREFYFRSYGSFVLILFLASMTAVAAFFLTRHKRSRSGLLKIDREIEQQIYLSCIWSALSFAAMFVFYVRFSSITSRYFLDFMPSLFVAIATLMALLIELSSKIPSSAISRAVQILLPAMCLVYSGLAPIQVRSGENPQNVDIEYVRRESKRWLIRMPKLPAEYLCGEKSYQNEIAYNTIGWNPTTNCSVSQSSQFFMEDLACIQIQVAPLSGERPNGLSDYSDIVNQVRVKVGFNEWRRVLQTSEGSLTKMTFCPKVLDPVKGAIDLVVILWVKRQDVARILDPNVKLLSVRNVEEPNAHRHPRGAH